MNVFLLALIVGFSANIFAQNSCASDRYKKQIFSSVTKTSQVYFGTADPYGPLTQPQDLYLDIYEPTGDTLANRPVIVYAYGGAFLIGNKIQPPIPDYCEAFAKMGYVVVAIDYRIGFNPLSTESAIRAVYRAAQDLRASVRYLCQRQQQYRIDTASVILTGSSAGCFAGLHSTYFEENQRPLATFGIPLENTDLGCFDCAGNNDYGKRLPKIRALVNHWGALLDTLLIENDPDENCPVISFHGDGDVLVPYGTGNPFSYPVFPNVYGSEPIHKRLDNLGIKNKFVSLNGFGHEPWLLAPELLDTAYKYTSEFLYDVLMPEPQKITGDSIACVGEVISLSALLRDRSNYCWDVQGNAGNVLIANHDLTFTCADTGWITITLTENNYLDIASKPIQFKVRVLPKPKANFEVMAVNELTVSLNDLAENNTSVFWDAGNGFTKSGSLSIYTYSSPGSYLITQVAGNAACTDTFTKVAEVDTCPAASFTYVFSGDSLLLLADSSNATIFSWSISGTNVQGQNAVVILPNTGVVAVTLTVENKLGCSKSVVQFVSKTISGGVNDVIDDEEPKVFPNPAIQKFYIDLGQFTAARYKLFDVAGCVKMSERFIGSIQVDVSNLPNGIYFLEISSDRKTHTEKLVINN